jgi:hypothetical protein
MPNIEAPVIASPEQAFECAVKECDRKKLGKKDKAKIKEAEEPCLELGRIKHECVKNKMAQRDDVQNEPSYDTGRKPPERLMRSEPNQNQPCPSFWSAWASVQRNCKAQKVAYKPGRMRRPDCVIGDDPPRKVLDAKFPCPDDLQAKLADPKAGVIRSASTPGEQCWRPGQKEAYEKIAGDQGEVRAVSPQDAADTQCPKG